MTEKKELSIRPTSVPERQGPGYLAGFIQDGLQRNDFPQVRAFVREYIRRFGENFPVSPVPDPLELQIAALFDVYRVLNDPRKYAEEVDRVPDWLPICGDGVLEEPFRRDYLESLDSLLSRPEKSGIEASIKVSKIVRAEQEYKGKIADSLMAILFEEPFYSVETLGEMGEEEKLGEAQDMAKKQLLKDERQYGLASESPFGHYTQAINVLNALGIDIDGVEEVQSIRETHYKAFQEAKHPNKILWNMSLSIGFDLDRLLEIVKQDLVENENPGHAGGMARAFLMRGSYEIGDNLTTLANITTREGVKRPDLIRYLPISHEDLSVIEQIRDRFRKELETGSPE